MFFQGGSICSWNTPYYFIEQILIFPEILIFSPRIHTNFPGASIFSSNRYSFSRKPYLILEHIQFSRRPYLVLEHIPFSRRPLCLEGIFQEGTPSRTDISLIGTLKLLICIFLDTRTKFWDMPLCIKATYHAKSSYGSQRLQKNGLSSSQL